MRTLIVALLLLALPAGATDHVTIAIRTNQFDGPKMVKLFTKLGEHVAPKHLSDSFHGLKDKGHIKGGQWIGYTNAQGHVFMVNNFRKSELEAATTTHQHGQEYTDENGDTVRDVTNTVTHGRTVSAARLLEVRDGSSQAALKMSINQNPSAQLASWGLFAIKEDEE